MELWERGIFPGNGSDAVFLNIFVKMAPGASFPSCDQVVQFGIDGIRHHYEISDMTAFFYQLLIFPGESMLPPGGVSFGCG